MLALVISAVAFWASLGVLAFLTGATIFTALLGSLLISLGAFAATFCLLYVLYMIRASRGGAGTKQSGAVGRSF